MDPKEVEPIEVDINGHPWFKCARCPATFPTKNKAIRCAVHHDEPTQYFDMRTRELQPGYPNWPENCQRCGDKMTVENEHHPSGKEWDNEVQLIVTGGYGSFFDALPHVDESGPLRMFLCHDCGHALSEFLNVDPTSWHSHRQEYVESHPDHSGWDYIYRAEKEKDAGI